MVAGLNEKSYVQHEMFKRREIIFFCIHKINVILRHTKVIVKVNTTLLKINLLFYYIFLFLGEKVV